MAPDLPPAGWYHDPELPHLLRWWDGERWLDVRQPAPTGPPSPRAAHEPLIVSTVPDEMPVLRLGKPAPEMTEEERSEDRARVCCSLFLLGLGSLTAVSAELAVFMAQATVGNVAAMAARAETVVYCLAAVALLAALGAAGWFTNHQVKEAPSPRLGAAFLLSAALITAGSALPGRGGWGLVLLGAALLTAAAGSLIRSTYRHSLDLAIWPGERERISGAPQP
jgi:hypothetical protein